MDVVAFSYIDQLVAVYTRQNRNIINTLVATLLAKQLDMII